jgi:outer membrane protein OmpA-like peptidoglycan-associated protein
MRLAARFIATMAVAFVIVPALYAGDPAKAKARGKKDEPATSLIAPTVSAKAQPNAAGVPPARSSTSRRSQSGGSAHPAGRRLRRDNSQNYTPKVEWFLGYSFWRAMPTSPNNRIGYLNGGSTSVAYNFNSWLGVVGDFGGFANTKLTLFSPTVNRTVDANGSAYTYAVGPRFSYRRHEGFTPFFQVLFGGTHMSSVTISGCSGDPSCTPLGSENAFLTMLGTGFDIKISHHVALRLLEGDFLLTNAFSTGGPGQGWQKSVQLSSGIVFRFGGDPGKPAPPPSIPITAYCTADKEFVYAGSDDFVVVRAQASNPDNNPLNYSWSASEGAVDGTGSEVRWNSSDRRLGTYTIRARVDNGRNGTADCSANIRVEPRPNRPPTISCSADHRAVTVGESVEITATASDPDGDPMSLSWNASAGRIQGSGSSVRFQTAGLPPGSYTIRGHVDDGRNGTADCSVNVEAQAAQVPAEVKELETRLALHSIYFATSRPTIANPAGGLVESQQKVLLSLASDFNRYLTYKPQAHLILEGHADLRGSMEYNKSLTERRVERSKGFLVEHGVPAANIETRALGKQENLDDAQVKQLIEQNPDLSNEERKRIEVNLQVIVLANNRRVDISLNTTGQQSVRQYPFNARDSLTLLSTQGGESEKRTRQPARKKKTAKP